MVFASQCECCLRNRCLTLWTTCMRPVTLSILPTPCVPGHEPNSPAEFEFFRALQVLEPGRGSLLARFGAFRVWGFFA